MKGPLQDLFDFSKKEQVGLMVLVAIILACLVVLNFDHVLFPRETVDASDKEKALISAINDIKEQEEIERTKSRSSFSKSRSLPEPFTFDPNMLDMEGYVNLGFSEKQAKSIRKYLDKGGRINRVDEFKKLYVVNDFMFSRLKDFIQIEDQILVQKQVDKRPTEKSEARMHAVKEEEIETITSVDLNATNLDELMALKGIGPIYAKRILSYGELLGGYASVDQLKEVYGLKDNPEIIESLRASFIIDHTKIDKIDINLAEWKDFVRHPYIDKKVANSIVNMRETHGDYRSVEELSRSHLISDELLSIVSPYLMVIE